MNNFKSTTLGLVKWIGLIALSLLINAAPMLFLRLGKNLPIYAEILLVALYLILVFLIFRSLWRRYQKHVPEEKIQTVWQGHRFCFSILFPCQSGCYCRCLSQSHPERQFPDQ